jgi:hypothetical protein
LFGKPLAPIIPLGMTRLRVEAFGSFALAASVTLSGCSSVGGSAVRTGPVQLPAYAGPVAVYASGRPPEGAVDLGVVEVHAAQQEATVDTLLPQFVRKVAEIGGNVAVVEGVRARFEIVPRTHVETFYFTCGMGATCAGTRVYSANDELMRVSMFGHAFSTQPDAARAAPLMPPGETGDTAPAPPPPPPSDAGAAPAPAPAPEEEGR